MIELLDGAVAQIGDRSGFPRLGARSYLNHAGVSPPSIWVEAAVSAAVQAYASRGVDAIPDEVARRERLRGAAAALIGAPAAQIALTGGATRALIDLAACLQWRPGDRVLVFEGEFPANVTPWQAAAKAEGLSLTMLPLTPFWGGSGDGLAAVEAELQKGGVRLIAVSAVQFQTGLRMPLRALSALAHAHGALLCVDAIQAVGLLPLDFVGEGHDFLVTGAHKWLMGMEGAGFCAASPAGLEALSPRVAGWLSHEEALSFLFLGQGHLRYDRPVRGRIDFLETGAPNVLGHVALSASVEPLLKIGLDDIFVHVGRWNDAAEAALLARGFRSLRSPLAEQRSGILSVDPPPGIDAGQLHAALNRRGLACAYPDGRLRFAPHWPNAIGEVDVLIEIVDEAVAELGGGRPLGAAAARWPACARNRGPLLGALAAALPSSGRLLEIASGTGEHSAFFARHLPGWIVQPSDHPSAARESIAAFAAWAEAPNLRPPIELDAVSTDWACGEFDAVLCCNMIHISPWEATLGLLAGAATHLSPGGLLLLYGPYLEEGVETAPSNLAFDADLRRRDPRWGIRDLGEVSAAAAAVGLQLGERRAMPANNLFLVFHRVAAVAEGADKTV